MRFFFKFITATVFSVISLIAIAFLLCNLRPVELHGLDKTNSNAKDRGILIHPAVGPLRWGCVTLPVVRYHQLSELLDSLPQNVIMWVYE